MITNKCKIINDKIKGNSLIATEEFNEIGEVLFSEESFASIPLELNKEYCFLCCKDSLQQSTSGNMEQCKFGCNMWFCSETCSNDMTHQLECSFINKFIESAIKNECDVSTSLLALRIIIKNKIKSDEFSETVGKLTNQKSLFMDKNKEFVEKYLNHFDQVTAQLTAEGTNPSVLSIFNRVEYIEIVCSIYVNSFAGLSNDFSRTPISNGYFYKAALLNHSCEPNIFFTIQDSNLEMRTIKKIEKNQEILDCYVDLLLPTIERQNILLNSKNFICKCSRCTDATENGRFISSMFCFHCDDGANFISPIVSFNNDTKKLQESWKCSNKHCKFNISRNNNNEMDPQLKSILQDIKEFKEYINGKDLLFEDLKEEDKEQEMPIIENILKKLLKYERELLSRLHLNNRLWLMYHIRLSKTFEKLASVFNSFDYLVQSIQHYKELTRIVDEIFIDSTSSEVVDCYYHLGRINEKYLLSLIKQRNQFIQLKLQNKNKESIDIEKLNTDIKNLLKFVNQSYTNSYNKSVLLYGKSHPKSISLNNMVLKSNLKSTNENNNETKQ